MSGLKELIKKMYTLRNNDERIGKFKKYIVNTTENSTEHANAKVWLIMKQPCRRLLFSFRLVWIDS